MCVCVYVYVSPQNLEYNGWPWMWNLFWGRKIPHRMTMINTLFIQYMLHDKYSKHVLQ